MDDIKNAADLREYKTNFEKLQVIAYKDIYINGVGIRNLGIHLMDFGPEWNVKKHRHSFFELHYVAENYTYTSINENEHKVGQDSFYLMPPGTYHSHREEPGEGHVGFAVRWEFIKPYSSKNKGLIETPDTPGIKMFNEFEKIPGALQNISPYPVKDNGEILDEMLLLLRMAGEDFSGFELQIRFVGFVLKLMRYYMNMTSCIGHRTEVNQTFLENNIVNSAVKFIEENYDQDIDVNDIANSAHSSYSHLSRLFKKQMGETITGYLNKMRLSKAQQLLLCSSRSVFQVARDAGFNNEYYFCSLFKRIYGISPGEFRKNKAILSE